MRKLMMITGIVDLFAIVFVCILLYDVGRQETLTPFVDLDLLAGKMSVLPDDKSIAIEDLPGLVFPSNTLLVAYQRAESRVEYINFAFYTPTNSQVSLMEFNLFAEDICNGHPTTASRKSIKQKRKYYFNRVFNGNGERTVPNFQMKDVKSYRSHTKRIKGELALSVVTIETNHGTYICGDRVLF